MKLHCEELILAWLYWRCSNCRRDGATQQNLHLARKLSEEWNIPLFNSWLLAVGSVCLQTVESSSTATRHRYTPIQPPLSPVVYYSNTLRKMEENRLRRLLLLFFLRLTPYFSPFITRVYPLPSDRTRGIHRALVPFTLTVVSALRYIWLSSLHHFSTIFFLNIN